MTITVTIEHEERERFFTLDSLPKAIAIVEEEFEEGQPDIEDWSVTEHEHRHMGDSIQHRFRLWSALVDGNELLWRSSGWTDPSTIPLGTEGRD